MQFSELLTESKVAYRHESGSLSVNVEHITDDSRYAGPTTLFCATGNGMAFVKEAAASGSMLLLPESVADSSLYPDSISVRVPSPERAMGHLSAALEGNPSRRMTVVAVTGTNGKTTTTQMLYHLWKKSGLPCALIGTLGMQAFDGKEEVHRETGFTTPRSYELQAILRELLEQGIYHVTLEASSEALTLGRLEGLEISGVLFTGLGRDHLDHHQTEAAYMRAKLHLFFLAARSRNSTPLLGVHAETAAKQAIEAFSRRLKLNIQWVSEDEITSAGDQPVPVRFNRINAALARKAYSYFWKQAMPDVSLTDFRGVPGRMERITLSTLTDAFVDYAHSPDSLERVLTEARTIGYNSIIVVFGCGGNRDAGKRQLMGRLAAELSDMAIITDDNPRTEDPALIRKQIMQGAKGLSEDSSKSGRLLEIGDRSMAIKRAIRIALDLERSGEKRTAVIIAGKGHETYQILGREKIHFSDREEILRCLDSR